MTRFRFCNRGAATRQLRLHRALAGPQVYATLRLTLPHNPCRVFSRQKAAHRNLHGDAGLGEGRWRVADKDLAIRLVNGVSRPLPIDKGMARQMQRVTSLLPPDREFVVARHPGQRAAQTADDGVEGGIPGIWYLIAPDSVGQIIPAHRTTPVQYQIGPEQTPLPPGKVGFRREPCLNGYGQATTNVDTGRCPRVWGDRFACTWSFQGCNLFAMSLQSPGMILLSGLFPVGRGAFQARSRALPRQREAAMTNVVRCSCGIDLRDPDETRLIVRVQEHAKEAHDLDLNDEQVRAMMEIEPS